ncbi:MAG: long-chain fatty acid--CoA ligase [Betaproteobacteria bacterium]|nr:long-chain fatty acid--CoA ligase [Betaproteobacteria bacterium]
MFTRHYPHWPPGQPKSIEVPTSTVYENLAANAARQPEAIAIDYYGERVSYARLKREADAFAGFLQARLGVRKGDRVLLYLQNSPQFVVAYYGVMRADAVVVPVNPMNLADELRHYIEDAGTQVAVVGQDRLAQVQPLLGASRLQNIVLATYSDYLPGAPRVPVPEFVKAPAFAPNDERIFSFKAVLSAACAPGPHLARSGDLAVMPYTSGTTGKPKGCMHTHRNVQSTTIVYLAWRGAGDGAATLSALPFFHVTGMQAGMNGPLHKGATIVIMSRWDRDCAAMLIEQARVTNWSAITTMLVDFLSNPNLPKYDLSSLKVLGGGGAAMPEALARKLEDVFKLPYVEGYGLSETMAPTHINPPHRPKRQCAGIPIFSTDARVVDLETFRDLGPGEVGEIIVDGPQVFQGYWNQPEASAQVFIEHDGKRFFRTGDLGYYDEEGYFFITDRLKRMINASGFKVWPAEVEAMLYAHPDIQEACVIGTRDPYRGETVKALVVLKRAAQGVGPEAIVEWAKTRMAAFKVPRVIEFVEELPKTATGKILWRKLQEEENRRTS